ncbi:hypothetical protein BZA05DRAFT_415620 [Tricharina praecox]|uniref:uncharacterized protein n=1 Tax=Tricharina praecox TaxID=43433 RepID=UPI00221FF822|nr:uncharacterized protein BZA05DRAFT_415620 [Tricharina praecox]KAI5856895.1 hypothetical protein BZA05DRAFT_415620 [Tricharina praecox]
MDPDQNDTKMDSNEGKATIRPTIIPILKKPASFNLFNPTAPASHTTSVPAESHNTTAPVNTSTSSSSAARDPENTASSLDTSIKHTPKALFMGKEVSTTVASDPPKNLSAAVYNDCLKWHKKTIASLREEIHLYTEDARKWLHPADYGFSPDNLGTATLSFQQGCYRQMKRINSLSIELYTMREDCLQHIEAWGPTGVGKRLAAVDREFEDMVQSRTLLKNIITRLEKKIEMRQRAQRRAEKRAEKMMAEVYKELHKGSIKKDSDDRIEPARKKDTHEGNDTKPNSARDGSLITNTE